MTGWRRASASSAERELPGVPGTGAPGSAQCAGYGGPRVNPVSQGTLGPGSIHTIDYLSHILDTSSLSVTVLDAGEGICRTEFLALTNVPSCRREKH